MRRVLAVLVMLLSIMPAFAVQKYFIYIPKLEITLLNINTSYYDRNQVWENLAYYTRNLTQVYFPEVPAVIWSLLDRTALITDSGWCYDWEQLFRYYWMLMPSINDSVNILLFDPGCGQDCMCTTQTRLVNGSMDYVNVSTPVYEMPNIAMVNMHSLNDVNESERAGIVTRTIVYAVSDVFYPYNDRVNITMMPLLLNTQYHIILTACNLDIENVPAILAELENALPDDIDFTHEVIECDDADYAGLMNYENKEQYLIMHPEVFNLADYNDPSTIPILVYYANESTSVSNPFFIMKSCTERRCYAVEDVLRLIGEHFGLIEHNVSGCVMGPGTDFDSICEDKLDMIFDDYRLNVTIRDALLRIVFISRLNHLLELKESGSLKFYPGFLSTYDSIISAFKYGSYAAALADSDELIQSLHDAELWDSGMDGIWQSIQDIEGSTNCVQCGSGCYVERGLCCNGAYVFDAMCCDQSECGLWQTCSGHHCELDTLRINTYLIQLAAICLPIFLSVIIFKFGRRQLRYRSIRKYFRGKRDAQVPEDRIYFEIFQKGYRKEDVERALKHVKIIGDKDGSKPG